MRKKIIYMSLLIIMVVIMNIPIIDDNIEYTEIVLKEEIKNEEISIIPTELNNLRDTYNNQEIISILTIGNSSKIITRSQDNDYYLNHNLRRKLNENGTPFMDYRISPIDQKIIIYLNDNDLNNYLNKEYYKNNQLLTLESDKYLCEYQIFSVFNIDENDDNYKRLEYTDEDWNNYINELNESSIYKDIKADYDNDIIILKSPNTIDTNLLVIGKKTSQKEI